MGLITNEAEFISYVKRMLGNPVINVEVADVNISDCIYDGIQEFQRYGIGEGSVRDVMVVNLSAGVPTYDLSGYGIDAVIDLQLTQNTNSINTLFSPQHTLLYADWVNHGAYPGGPGGSGGAAGMGGAMIVSNYFITMTYLSEIEELFCRKYVCRFNEASGQLTVTPTPNIDTVGLIFVFRKETAINLYNHPLVKKLVIAKVKKIWGRSLNKQSISFPGGGTLNGGEIKQEGIDEEKEILERISAESSPPIFMVG